MSGMVFVTLLRLSAVEVCADWWCECVSFCLNFGGVYGVGVCVIFVSYLWCSLCCCMLFVSYIWVLFVVL